MCGLFAFWEYDKSMTKCGEPARTSADETLRSGRINLGYLVCTLGVRRPVMNRHHRPKPLQP